MVDQLYDMFWYALVADAVETLILPRYNLRWSYTLTFKFFSKKPFFRTWRFTNPDQLLIVFWNDFAVITPLFTFKLRNPHTGSYIST